MIVDVHTHIVLKEHLSKTHENSEVRGVPIAEFISKPEDHFRDTKRADKVFILGFQAPFSGINIPNDFIADYVKRDPSRFIGFMSVDPNNENCLTEMERCKTELDLKGLKLLPMYQDFHPIDHKIAYPVYKKAQELSLPILFHMGTTYTRESKLKYTLPILIEDIAHDFPQLKIIIAHLGHPWEKDTIVLIRKQPNVFADISALYYRPWQCYNSLRLATEYGVFDKLLFGTDYPATTIESTIKGLFAICVLARKANLPPIKEEDIELLINRDTLKLLDLEKSKSNISTN